MEASRAQLAASQAELAALKKEVGELGQERAAATRAAEHARKTAKDVSHTLKISVFLFLFLLLCMCSYDSRTGRRIAGQDLCMVSRHPKSQPVDAELTHVCALDRLQTNYALLSALIGVSSIECPSPDCMRITYASTSSQQPGCTLLMHFNKDGLSKAEVCLSLTIPHLYLCVSCARRC